MSTTGLTRTTLGDLLLRQYTPGKVEEQQRLSSELWDRLQERPLMNSGGDGLYFGVNVEGDEADGYIDETQGFPGFQNEVNLQARVRPKVHVGPFRTTGLGKRLSPGGAKSFVNGLTQNIDNKIRRMTDYTSASCYRDGTGLLGLVNEPSSVPDTTSGNLNVDGGNIIWFRENMVLDFYSTGGVLQATSKVTAVDFANNAIELADNIASLITDNSAIYKNGTQNSDATATKEVSGFQAAIATSGSYLNISRSTNPVWQGNVINASGAVLDEDRLQQADDRVEILGAGKSALSYFMHPFQVRAYFDLVSSRVRFAGIAGSLDAGYKSLDWSGRDIVPDRQAQEDTVWGINLQHFFKAFPDDGKLQIQKWNGQVLNWDQGFDAGVGYLVEYPEIVTDRPNAHFRLHNLAVTSNR